MTEKPKSPQWQPTNRPVNRKFVNQLRKGTPAHITEADQAKIHRKAAHKGPR